MKQLLPQLDNLIRMQVDALRETEQLRRILKIRLYAYRVLETTVKTGTIPVTFQQAIVLCQQMNSAIQELSSGRHAISSETTIMRRTDTSIQGETVQPKKINPEALRLAELLVREEVRDFEEDFPGSNLDIKIECLKDRIVIAVGDLAKLIVHPGYPAIPVDIESDTFTAHITVTNCLQYFESESDNKDTAL